MTHAAHTMIILSIRGGHRRQVDLGPPTNNQREQHIKIKPRTLSDGLSEVELDEMVRALG